MKQGLSTLPSFTLISCTLTSSMSAPRAFDRTARYSTTAIALHWLLGLALLGLLGMGIYMTGLPFSPQRLKLYNWHKWAGTAFLGLSLLRLLWRLTHRPPALPQAMAQAMPGWQKAAHHGTHHLLYALFIAVPLIGWAYSSAAGFPVVFLGLWQLPDFVPVSKELAATIKPLHKIGALTLAALALLHIGAALKHHWIDRDGLLARMSLRT